MTFHTSSAGSLGAGSLLSGVGNASGLRAVSEDMCVLGWEVGHAMH